MRRGHCLKFCCCNTECCCIDPVMTCCSGKTPLTRDRGGYPSVTHHSRTERVEDGRSGRDVYTTDTFKAHATVGFVHGRIKVSTHAIIRFAVHLIPNVCVPITTYQTAFTAYPHVFESRYPPHGVDIGISLPIDNSQDACDKKHPFVES